MGSNIDNELNGKVGNPFNNPSHYRNLILKNDLLKFKKEEPKGKALACLFLTRFCSTGCPFCFYKSAPAWRKRNIQDQFNDFGVQKFISFSHEANLSYLLISGGGEPLNQRKHILQIIKEATADRIVLVTSGNWAKSYNAAKRYVDDIYKALESRVSKATVILRLSVSEGHTIKIGLDPTINLINIFSTEYRDHENYRLQIKTFDNDPTFDKVLETFPGYIKSEQVKLTSDNSILVKKIPTKYTVKVNGYSFIVGLSKIFNSGLRPDLNNLETIKQYMDVFDKDLEDSEDDNPTIVSNSTNTYGIDWSINYNGDICTWQNQVRDNYMNLYEDDYKTIWNANFNDPITYSMIDKGNAYRNKIVSEVDKHAVLRTKAIGLRDTSGTIIFEEERTRLYYAIRVLQDYIADGKISNTDMQDWPESISSLVNTSAKLLAELYHNSTYNILEQQKAKMFSEICWRDLFRLVKLGHYILTNDEVSNAIDYYNKFAENKISSINDVDGFKKDLFDIERRLTERLMHTKPLKILKEDAA